jgi:hypothetical protein
MSEPNWKHGKMLTVKGTMARPGTYKANSGKEYQFTPRLVNQIFSDTNKPYATHVSHEDRSVGGFGKIGYDNKTDTLHYYVNVYDPAHIQRILYEGVDKVSPEIEFDTDTDGNPIGGHVTDIAFVTNPKIDGTQATSKDIQMFGEMDMKFKLVQENGEYKFVPDVENFGETGMQPVVGAPSVSTMAVTGSGIQAPAMPTATSTAPLQGTSVQGQPNITINMPDMKPTTAPTGAASTGASLEPTSHSNEYQAKYEALLNTQVATVANELKSMGIANPDLIGKDIPPEQRLTILKAIKDNFVSSNPGVMPTNTEMGGNPAGQPNRDEQLASTMRKAGIDPKLYMKYFKE